MKFKDNEIKDILNTYADVANQDYASRTVIVKLLADSYKVSENVIRGNLNAQGVYKKKEEAVKGVLATAADKEALICAIEDVWGVKMLSMRNMSMKDLTAFWAKFIEMSNIKEDS